MWDDWLCSGKLLVRFMVAGTRCAEFPTFSRQQSRRLERYWKEQPEELCLLISCVLLPEWPSCCSSLTELQTHRGIAKWLLANNSNHQQNSKYLYRINKAAAKKLQREKMLKQNLPTMTLVSWRGCLRGKEPRMGQWTGVNQNGHLWTCCWQRSAISLVWVCLHLISAHRGHANITLASEPATLCISSQQQ